VTPGGRRVAVRRPRVRTVARDDQPVEEAALESYEAFAESDLLAEGIVARMLAGISTRRYPVSLEPVGEQVEQTAQSTSKSAVSRRFVAATAERLAELDTRRFDDQRWLVVFIDGFGFGDHTMVGALGVTADGTKVPLGVVEGSTENAAVCTRLIAGWPSAAWMPAAGCYSWSMAARPQARPSATSTAVSRSYNDAVVTRSATSPTTCPSPSAH
jgi:putative transposase